MPAYAITVHKAQGSEYPVVVLPLARQHGRMLRRNLVYTAITRAKRLVVLVVEGDALELAIAGRPEPRRWSKLRELLRCRPCHHAPAAATSAYDRTTRASSRSDLDLRPASAACAVVREAGQLACDYFLPARISSRSSSRASRTW